MTEQPQADNETPVQPMLSKSSSRRGGFVYQALTVLLGVVAFVVVGSALSAWKRASGDVPYIAVLSEKTEDYARQADDYDIVFLGTSQTFRHIDAPRINADLAERGLPNRVYNFGVPALIEPELRLLVDTVLENRTEALKYVVVQNPLRSGWRLDNMMTDRGRYFRSGSRAATAIQDVFCHTGTHKGRAIRAKNNAQVIIAENLALGQMAKAVFPNPNSTEHAYDDRYRTNAGFWPVDQDMNAHIVARGENTPMTEDMMSFFVEGGADYVSADGFFDCRVEQLLDTIGKIEDAGLTPVFFVPPNPRDPEHDRIIMEKMQARRPDMMVLDFGVPSEHRETLFKADLWFDHSHMNGAGAAVLADLISAELTNALIAGQLVAHKSNEQDDAISTNSN